eukprot:358541-Prymnesium_polylepis.1
MRRTQTAYARTRTHPWRRDGGGRAAQAQAHAHPRRQERRRAEAEQRLGSAPRGLVALDP